MLADVGCLKACYFLDVLGIHTADCYQHIPHLLVACNNVEDLALVHFAPSGRSGAFGLRSALRFAGLLTEEATVTATCFRVFDSDQGCTMHKLAYTQLVSPLPHPRTSFRKLHLVSRGSRDMDSFYRDSMDQCNLWTLDRVDIFPICIMFSFSSAKLLLLLSLK